MTRTRRKGPRSLSVYKQAVTVRRVLYIHYYTIYSNVDVVFLSVRNHTQNQKMKLALREKAAPLDKWKSERVKDWGTTLRHNKQPVFLGGRQCHQSTLWKINTELTRTRIVDRVKRGETSSNHGGCCKQEGQSVSCTGRYFFLFFFRGG